MTNSQVWTNPWAFSSEITLGLCSSWSNISQTSLALAEQILTELLPQPPPPPPPVLQGMHQKNEEHEKEQGAFCVNEIKTCCGANSFLSFPQLILFHQQTKPNTPSHGPFPAHFPQNPFPLSGVKNGLSTMKFFCRRTRPPPQGNFLEEAKCRVSVKGWCPTRDPHHAEIQIILI